MKQGIKASKEIGEIIRALRIERKWTQDNVAARLQLCASDLSRGTYAKIEAGIRHISLKELKALAHVFEVDYNTLLGYDNKRED